MKQLFLAASALAALSLSGCNCGPPSTHPVQRPARTATGQVAGGAVAHSPRFTLVGSVTSPVATVSRSQRYELHDGVVGVTQP